MKKDSLLDRYLSAKFIIGATIKFPILIGGGTLGIIFSWLRLPFYPLSNIFGIILLVIGHVIHLGYSHKELRKYGIHPHQHSTEIERLVSSGLYSKARHPGYLGLVLIYFGFAFGFGVAWMLIPAVIFTVLTYLAAIKEEKLLEQQFGKGYEKYKRQVPWKFIPNVL
ncbi:MAG: isoprenylcysteine carboxylmethyltransferase family protein [Candidatus Thermoplasmatota archaeon]|nr:isoprenylcysteine carboxylmethyltransferase family protein [Candidatus Thermoplasmatota archaeon]